MLKVSKKNSQKILKSGLHILLWKEDKWFVAKCLEVEVASQGQSKKEAFENIEEALDLYFEEEKVPFPDPMNNLELHSFPLNVSYA